MPSYKATRQLAAADAAYIAGLVDGEGTITLSRRHARDRRQLVVSIANTERPLLDFVLERIGTGKNNAETDLGRASHTFVLLFDFQSAGAGVGSPIVAVFAIAQARPCVIDPIDLFASDAEEWQVHDCDRAG